MTPSHLHRAAPTLLCLLKKYRYWLLGVGVLALWLDIQAAPEPLWRNAVLVGVSHLFVLVFAGFFLYLCRLAAVYGTGPSGSIAPSPPAAPAWQIQAAGGGPLQHVTPQCRLFSKGTLVVGRDGQCDIHIPEKPVSRKHFKLVARKGSLFVVDLKSANGTYVNDVKIPPKKRVAVNPGDVIVPGAPHRVAGLSVERN